MNIQDSIKQCELTKSAESFKTCAELYNKSDLHYRQDIMSMLLDIYYRPYEQDLRKYYEHNVDILSKYPYLWDKSFCSFDNLSFLLFHLSDDCYYLYDKILDRFIGEYDGTTHHQMRYFFKSLDDAIKVEDEDSLYNLTFLFDNVRRSEDIAKDNHIYLLYNSWQPLQRAMQMGDFSPILEHEKFVFLIGPHNHCRYPINFKEQYGIDYSLMPPQRLKIEDLNRIYLSLCYGHSGNLFWFEVLNASDNTVVVALSSVYPSLNDYINKKIKTIITPEAEVNVQDFIEAANSHIEDIPFKIWPKILQFLPEVLANYQTVAVHQLVKAILIAYMNYTHIIDNKQYESRITPVIFFDPHSTLPWDFYPLMKCFKYHALANIFREPVTRLARAVSTVGLGMSPNSVRANVCSTYMHSKFIPKWFTDKGYYTVRFEDLKLKPYQTLHTMCRTFNIPFTDKLLIGKTSEVFAHWKSENEEIQQCFDLRATNRDISNFITPEDRDRLNLFYWPILKYFGYPCTPTQKRLSKEEAEQLFSKPFLFEKRYQEQRLDLIKRINAAPEEQKLDLIYDFKASYGVEPDVLRKTLKDTMVDYYIHGFDCNLVLPQVLWPEDEDCKEESQAERLSTICP